MDQVGAAVGTEPVDVGGVLLGVGVGALVVDSALDEGLGAAVGDGVGSTVGVGVGTADGVVGGGSAGVGVTEGLGVVVLVLPRVGPGLGFSGLLLTGLRSEGTVVAVAGRTKR